MDYFCLGYVLSAAILILIFQQSIQNWSVYFLQHSLISLIIFALILLAKKPASDYIITYVRILYPIILMVYAWNSLNKLIPLMYGNYWGTHYMVAADKFIFGVHPTIWVQQYYRPWLDETLSIFYLSYYGIISITLIGLIIRRELSDLHRAISIVSVTYFTNFLIFIIIPVLGPQMTSALQELSHETYSGFFVSDLLKQMQLNGGIRGGAFPSSHVSGGLVWTIICFKYFKKIGIFMIPLMAGITVATVYLGYQHAMDTITGLLWGIIGYNLTNFLFVRRHITTKAGCITGC